MTEQKKALHLTAKKQEVVGIIKGLYESLKKGSSPRIRKLLTKTTTFAAAKGLSVSGCLVSDTIKALLEAKILNMVEKGISDADRANGDHSNSVLYEWDKEAFAGYTIKTVTRCIPKDSRKKVNVPVEQVLEKKKAEGWYDRAVRELRETRAQILELTAKVNELEALIKGVDDSVENVQKFFADRGAK